MQRHHASAKHLAFASCISLMLCRVCCRKLNGSTEGLTCLMDSAMARFSCRQPTKSSDRGRNAARVGAHLCLERACAGAGTDYDTAGLTDSRSETMPLVG
jgi:hypothetical protein